MHFKAKHLAYIPKVWHHFITSRLIPTINVCEVTTKKALLSYAIIQDIPFDVEQVIEDAILYNKDAKMNLGHPFLIYSLCKQVGVPLRIMRLGYTRSRRSWLRKTNRVYQGQRRYTNRAMSPPMRMSLESTSLGLGSL